MVSSVIQTASHPVAPAPRPCPGVSWPAMDDDRVLVVVSAAQLATGAWGLALALRRRRAFDLPFWHGRPSAVGRDALLMGTALSAPAVMLGAQAGAGPAPGGGPPPPRRRRLGGAGAAVGGRGLAGGPGRRPRRPPPPGAPPPTPLA